MSDIRRTENVTNVVADLQRQSERDPPASISGHVDVPDESRVLVIYTGGTIGMINDPPRGYIPVPNLLYDNLKEQARFNDPHGSSVLNAKSLDEYRKWQFRTATASTDAKTARSKSADSSIRSRERRRTLQMSSSATQNSSSSREILLPVKRNFNGSDSSSGHIFIPSLVTPKFHSERRVRYAILEYENLIDSSEVNMQDWIRIASDIELNYDLYDAFVVLHGTDTLAYTASALSFLLENLEKTVIVTGAQIPITYLRNDAISNLLDSLTLAGNHYIPEVGVCFSNRLFRGNRCIKASSFEFDAFQSPNLDPLVKLGIHPEFYWPEIMKPDVTAQFAAHKKMSENVAIIRIFPGITTMAVQALLSSPIQGIVLETFGAGNMPQREDLMQCLREASERGVVIVNVTQCQKGAVVDLYESGKKLREVGVVCGYDMTSECALTKLSYLLTKPNLNPEDIRQLMGTSLRGELTSPMLAA